MSDQVRYPGYVMRQLLVNELQSRVADITKKADSTFDMMNQPGLDEESINTLYQEYCSLLGQVTAMRDISEWAKEHSAPTIPVVSSSIKAK